MREVFYPHHHWKLFIFLNLLNWEGRKVSSGNFFSFFVENFSYVYGLYVLFLSWIINTFSVLCSSFFFFLFKADLLKELCLETKYAFSDSSALPPPCFLKIWYQNIQRPTPSLPLSLPQFLWFQALASSPGCHSTGSSHPLGTVTLNDVTPSHSSLTFFFLASVATVWEF